MNYLHLMKKNKIASFVKMLFLFNLFIGQSQAMQMTDSWLNFREAYLTGSKQFQTKIEYAAKFDDVLYFAIQNTSGHGDSLNQVSSRYNEIETNYKIPLSSNVSFYPGAVFNWSRSGSAFDPYVKLGFSPVDNVTLLVGYRYNKNNYSSVNIYNQLQNDGNHEVNIWLDWSVNERIWTEYNFTYHKRIGEFRYGNGSTENLEHTVAVSYKIDDQFTPYIDASWLDKAGNGDNEGRIRVGLFYHF